MTYNERVCAWCLLGFVLLLFLAVVTPPLYGEDVQTSPLSEPSTTSEQPSPTPSWSSLDQLLQMLESEQSASHTESTELLSKLLGSQIEANELRNSLGLSEKSLEDLKSSMEAERKAAATALETALREAQAASQRAERWKWGAIIASVLAAAGWGVAAFQAVF